MQITPQKVDPVTLRFCRALNPSTKPVFVEIKPDPHSEPRECFFNVQRHVERHGGVLIYGWRIWLWPRVFIEAEHHGIWQSPDGILLDVTPSPARESRSLFVRDNTITYDFEENKRRDNVRQSLTTDPLVVRYLELSAELHSLIETHSQGRFFHATQEFFELRYERARSLMAILQRYAGPNDLCPCHSGRKVKKCCGLEQVRQGKFIAHTETSLLV